MSLERLASKAYENTVAKPAANIVAAVKNEPNLLGKAPALAGEVAKEAALIPLRNIGSIMGWSLKSMMGILGSTVKLAGNAAMLIPLPIPGVKNAAEIRGSLTSLRERIDTAARGNTLNFADRVASIGRSGSDTEPAQAA